MKRIESLHIVAEVEKALILQRSEEILEKEFRLAVLILEVCSLCSISNSECGGLQSSRFRFWKILKTFVSVLRLMEKGRNLRDEDCSTLSRWQISLFSRHQ